MGGPWEDFAKDDGPWNDFAGTKDAPNDNTPGLMDRAGQFARQSVGSDSDILSNRPTGVMGTMARAMPGAMGAIAGAAAAAPYGAPLGPMGMFAAGLGGAYIGGTAGESARQAAVQMNNAATGQEFTPAGEVLQHVNREGLMNAAGEGAARLGGAALALPAMTKGGGTIADELSRTGGQVLKVLTNADSRSGAWMLRNPGEFTNAPTLKQAGEGFSDYMGQRGIVNGPAGAKQVAGKRMLGRDAKLDLMDSALDDVAKWESSGSVTGVDSQTGGAAMIPQPEFKPDVNKLIVAREQLKKLTETPAMRNEAAKSELRDLYSNMERLDSAIETLEPGYKGIRGDYRAASVRDVFSNPLPMNKHGQPNGLLPYLAAGVMGGGAGIFHNPAMLAAAPLFSPLTYGLATKATYRVVNSGAARAGAQGLADYYMAQRPAYP